MSLSRLHQRANPAHNKNDDDVPQGESSSMADHELLRCRLCTPTSGGGTLEKTSRSSSLQIRPGGVRLSKGVSRLWSSQQSLSTAANPRGRRKGFSRQFQQTRWSSVLGAEAVEPRFLMASCLLLLTLIGVNGLVMLLVRQAPFWPWRDSKNMTSRITWISRQLFQFHYNTSLDLYDDSSTDFLDGPPRRRYRPRDAFPGLGDWTRRYAHLRQEIDRKLEIDPVRSLARVNELIRPRRPPPFSLLSSVMTRLLGPSPPLPPYDVHHCPLEPPPHYPHTWTLLQILQAWDPDDTTSIPSTLHQSVCVFDYAHHAAHIRNYRAAEVPFVVTNDSNVARTTERWNVPGYLEALLGDNPHYCEKSASNHFMYYHDKPNKPRKNRRSSQPPPLPLQNDQSSPVEKVRMSYAHWLSHATRGTEHLQPNDAHWYFRLSAFGKGPVRFPPPPIGVSGKEAPMEYLYDELPFLQPRNESLYIVDPDGHKGIHCRFAPKGVISESHFDLGRNAIVVLRGSRRYILNPPSECRNLALYPRGHPSGRHSRLDWSSKGWEHQLLHYPEFAQARGHEVIVQAGQVLFLPALYFHYIVSLDDGPNIQCNARSGNPPGTPQILRDCGF